MGDHSTAGGKRIRWNQNRRGNAPHPTVKGPEKTSKRIDEKKSSRDTTAVENGKANRTVKMHASSPRRQGAKKSSSERARGGVNGGLRGAGTSENRRGKSRCDPERQSNKGARDHKSRPGAGGGNSKAGKSTHDLAGRGKKSLRMPYRRTHIT